MTQSIVPPPTITDYKEPKEPNTRKRHVRLTVDIVYEYQDNPDVLPDEQYIIDQLDILVQNAAGDGLMSGMDTDLVVDHWKHSIETVSTQ